MRGPPYHQLWGKSKSKSESEVLGRFQLASLTLETKWNQPDIWEAGCRLRSPRPAPSSTGPSPSSAYGDKATLSRRPHPSLLGCPRVLGKSCLGSPQIPPVPYNRSVNVSSTPTVPSQDPPNRRSPRPPSNPPKQGSPGSAHPQPALLSLQPAREAEKLVPAPLTASSFLRAASLHRPAVRSPGPSPALPPAPRPWAPAPPPLPQRPPGDSELAERSQRAPPGPGGHCLLSSPNPPPHNRRRPTPGGGGNAPGERPGRAETARPLPPRWPPPPPHLARRGRGVPAPGERRRAPCAQQLGAVPLGLRWWAPRRSVPCPGPSVPPAPPCPRRAPGELGAKKLPGSLQSGLYCGWRHLAARPIHRLQEAALSPTVQ